MREHKYRGLTKKEGWVYGDLVHKNRIKYPIIHFYDCNGFECCYEVDPKTVGEYTGLHDSKRTEEYPEGQEIYEGDIVKRETGCLGDEYDGFIGIVKFVEAAFVIESFDGKDGTSLGDDVAELEVLGNIYNNTDLLNQNSNWSKHYIHRFERTV